MLRLSLTYTILAVVATIANIASQDIVTHLYAGVFAITLSILFGTGVGLLVKYWLDKKYIFKFKATSIKHDAHTFFLYSVMGVTTTFIFWLFEYGFDYWLASKEGRYLGAIIGLSIGYITKYQLDKKFVFKQGGLACA